LVYVDRRFIVRWYRRVASSGRTVGGIGARNAGHVIPSGDESPACAHETHLRGLTRSRGGGIGLRRPTIHRRVVSSGSVVVADHRWRRWAGPSVGSVRAATLR